MSDRFSWGRVVDRFEIGPYTLLAFHPRIVEGGRRLREIDETKTHYHGYIGGKDTNESWSTLEDAMAGIIVKRILGPNHHAINYHFVSGLRAMAEST